MYPTDYPQTAQQVKQQQIKPPGQYGVQAQQEPAACLGDRNLCETKGYYEPSHAEQAEKKAAYHHSEATKALNAASFFRAHPEFEEFIKLIRSGAVQI